MISTDTAGGPLSGLRVVEARGEVATRYCGRLLAALGAQVVQVGDRSADPVCQPGEAGRAFSAWLDAGKIIAPDLPSALASLDGAPDKSLVIAGQTPEALREVDAELAGRRGVVRLGLTWFGDKGPYSGWRGHDVVIQSLTGLAFGFGLPDGPPIVPQGHAPQIITGLTGFIAGVAALMGGEDGPTRVDVNALESALCLTEIGAVAAAAMPDVRSGRPGVNRYAPLYPSTIYATADGHVGVTTLTPAQWGALCKLIDRPDLAAAAALATAADRLLYADELDELLAPLVASRPTSYWVEAGDRMRIPITPAPRPRDLPAMPHWDGRGAFARIDGAEVSGPTLPFHFSFDGVTSARPNGGKRGPLTGLRVADFTMGWAGPLATRYLGDLGAEVFKIESKAKPDWWRGWEIMEEMDPPPYEFPLNFMAVNRDKRGLDVDVTTPAGMATATALVRSADIVVDNQGPGVMDKLGLGPAMQRQLRPGVISMSMPPFGRTGPLSGLRAYGSTVEQASGMPFVNGHADWAPSTQHVAYGDPIAGIYGAAAVLAAIYGRSTLGGAEIDLCQVEAVFQLGADGIIADQVSPVVRAGTRRPAEAPSCVVRGDDDGEDAWLAVAVDSDAAWRALCAVVDEVALSPAWGLAERQARADAIEDALARWSAAQRPIAAAGRLQAVGVAAAPVSPSHGLWLDEHLRASGYWVVLNRRYIGDHLIPNSPVIFDGRRLKVTHPAPTLGEHTAEALAILAL